MCNIIFFGEYIYADAPWYIIPVKLVKFNSQTINIFLTLYGNEIRGVDNVRNVQKVIAFGVNAPSTKEQVWKGVDYNFDRINIIRKGIVTGDNLKLRKAPNLNSKTLYLIKKKTSIYILRRTKQKSKVGEFLNYWYEVKLHTGISGWLYGQYINIIPNFSMEVVYKNKSYKVNNITYFFTKEGLPYVDKIKVKKKYFLNSKIKYLGLQHISYILRIGKIRTDLGIEGYD